MLTNHYKDESMKMLTSLVELSAAQNFQDPPSFVNHDERMNTFANLVKLSAAQNIQGRPNYVYYEQPMWADYAV